MSHNINNSNMSQSISAKKDQLRDKVQRKALRQRTAKIKLVESSDDSDEDYFSKKSVLKAAKWWRRIDRHYFKQCQPAYLHQLQSQTTSPALLTLTNPIPHPKSNYIDKVLIPHFPPLRHHNSLRVLFQKQSSTTTQYHLVVYELMAANYSYQHIANHSNHSLVIPLNDERRQVNIPLSRQQQSNIVLECAGCTSDRQLIYKSLYYENICQMEMSSKERELIAWEQQLKIVNKKNIQNWQKLTNHINSQKKAQDDKAIQLETITNTQQEILSAKKQQEATIMDIRKYLYWSDILKYIQFGHYDKFDEMLEDTLEVISTYNSEKKKKSKHEKLKASFETDCKICFSTENVDNNKVVYCDGCNTSFHQSCYGVQRISKDQKFFCDSCIFIKNTIEKDKRPKKLLCQICYNRKFPLKQIDGHFYHVTCLFLFNLGSVKDFEIKLADNLTHSDIVQKVIDNQLEHGNCQYCVNGSQLGMQFSCVEQGCSKSYHPICAYLNGCFFEIYKKGHSLDVKIYCGDHIHERDLTNQIYLRRFFCDFKGTSKLSEQEFTQIYKDEHNQRAMSNMKEISFKKFNQLSSKFIKPYYISPFYTITPTKVINSYIQRLYSKSSLQSTSDNHSSNKNSKQSFKSKTTIECQNNNKLTRASIVIPSNTSNHSTHSQSCHIQHQRQ